VAVPDLLERWDRRLTNWALWEVSGSSHWARSSGYDRAWYDSPPRQTIALVGDAYDVDHLLHRLHAVDELGRLQFLAVRIRYVWTGTEDMKARQADIPARTLRDRVHTAKHRLNELEQLTPRSLFPLLECREWRKSR
jgi:hypothetical protein